MISKPPPAVNVRQDISLAKTAIETFVPADVQQSALFALERLGVLALNERLSRETAIGYGADCRANVTANAHPPSVAEDIGRQVLSDYLALSRRYQEANDRVAELEKIVHSQHEIIRALEAKAPVIQAPTPANAAPTTEVQPAAKRAEEPLAVPAEKPDPSLRLGLPQGQKRCRGCGAVKPGRWFKSYEGNVGVCLKCSEPKKK